MKVLQINSVCGIRSTGRICTDIAEILNQKGHDCLIAYGRETVPARYADIAIRTDSVTGVKLHALQSRVFDNSGFIRKKATEKLTKSIMQYAPDVIHLHNLHGYYINVEALFDFLKKYRKPVVWTLHDCWAFTGHCTHFDKIGCSMWKQGCAACPQKTRYPASYLFDRSKKNYQRKKELFQGVERMTIVTPSCWLASFVKQSFLKEYPLQVIHNGIDCNIFKPTTGRFREDYGIVNPKVVLGVASGFDAGKGFYDFLQLSKKIKPNYMIVLVGLTKRQAAELPDNIIGIERTNDVAQLAEIYAAADVFVNPTYEDNYPTTNLEAQCCGTPAITYNTGGSIESVPKTQVVNQGDIDALLKKIYDVCERGDFSLPERGQFDKMKAFEKYIALYETYSNKNGDRP